VDKVSDDEEGQAAAKEEAGAHMAAMREMLGL